jgi:cytochrome o ubiquinol oxidase subunit 1
LVSAGVFGAFMTLLAFSFRRQSEIEVTAEQIAGFERAHQAGVAA